MRRFRVGRAARRRPGASFAHARPRDDGPADSLQRDVRFLREARAATDVKPAAPGLRRPQIGALHAALAPDCLYDDRAERAGVKFADAELFGVPLIVVVGRGITVGRPLSLILTRRSENATTVSCHTGTRDLAAEVRQADIVVAAVGRPRFVQGDWIKPGATVIDVGINRVPSKDPDKAAEGKTRVVGDVAFAEAAEVAARITPVPGGVGPMTRACLLENTLYAAEHLHD